MSIPSQYTLLKKPSNIWVSPERQNRARVIGSRRMTMMNRLRARLKREDARQAYNLKLPR